MSVIKVEVGANIIVGGESMTVTEPPDCDLYYDTEKCCFVLMQFSGIDEVNVSGVNCAAKPLYKNW